MLLQTKLLTYLEYTLFLAVYQRAMQNLCRTQGLGNGCLKWLVVLYWRGVGVKGEGPASRVETLDGASAEQPDRTGLERGGACKQG
jgi:hypothetical protein